MVERAYTVTPVHPSASGISNLRLSFSGRGIRLWTHFLLLLCSIIAFNAKGIDLDQMPHSVCQLSLGFFLTKMIFFGHSRPSADSRRAVVSLCQKNVPKYWTCLEDLLPAQEKVWLGKPTMLGSKPQHKHKMIG